MVNIPIQADTTPLPESTPQTLTDERCSPAPLTPVALRTQCSVTAYTEKSPSAETDSTGESSGTNRFSTPVLSHEFTVTVKYVRRELRNLTDRDREAFFNAVSVMQRVPSAVGRVLFGDRYYSKDYINRLHIYYGEI